MILLILQRNVSSTQKLLKTYFHFILSLAFLDHILAKIDCFYGLWEEGNVKPLDTVVNKTEMLEATEYKEDLVNILQIVVIQDQSFKAGQWFEELLLQGLEMIEAETQLTEI